MDLAAWLVSSLLALALPGEGLPECSGQDEPTAAELEWSELQVSLTEKMHAYRKLPLQERRTVSFQGELARVGSFIRKYSQTEPDFAFAARIFMARSLLSDTLKKHNEALQILQTVVIEAPDPLVAGMAAVHAADVVVRTGRHESLVRLVRELYEKRPKPDPQFLDVLRSMELKAALRAGEPFPELEFKGLDGKEYALSQFRGRMVYIVFFNVVHDASRERLTAAVAVARASVGRPVQVVGVSLDGAPKGDDGPDLDAGRARVLKEMTRAGVTFPVAYDGLGWESPLAVKIGLRSIPATFLLDAKGRIVERDLPAEEVQSFIEFVLDQEKESARDKGDGGTNEDPS